MIDLIVPICEEFINRQKQQKEQFEFVDTRTDYQKRMNKKLRVV